MLFATGVTTAANSLVGNVNLITKVDFPRVLLPLSNVLAALTEFSAFARDDFHCAGLVRNYAQCPVAPVAGADRAGAGHFGGEGLWLAALNARYRDVRHALPFLVQMWMYSTPIVYSLTLVPAEWQPVAALNPLLTAVEMFRYVLLGTRGPAPR